jgi:hypothetical protein
MRKRIAERKLLEQPQHKEKYWSNSRRVKENQDRRNKIVGATRGEQIAEEELLKQQHGRRMRTVEAKSRERKRNRIAEKELLEQKQKIEGGFIRRNIGSKSRERERETG